jgi:hypothetical protein
MAQSLFINSKVRVEEGLKLKLEHYKTSKNLKKQEDIKLQSKWLHWRLFYIELLGKRKKKRKEQAKSLDKTYNL